MLQSIKNYKNDASKSGLVLQPSLINLGDDSPLFLSLIHQLGIVLLKIYYFCPVKIKLLSSINFYKMNLPFGKAILVLALLCNAVHFSYSQNQHLIDSLENVLKKLEKQKKDAASIKDISIVNILYAIGKEYLNNNPDKAMDYTNRSLTLAEQLNYNKGIANAYNSIGVINDVLSNYPNAIAYYKKSLKIREDIGDKGGIAATYSNIGIIRRKQGDLPEALKNHFKALKIREDIGDKMGIASSYNNIGIILKSQRKYEEALSNYQNALKIQQEILDKKNMALTYNNIGIVYKILDSNDIALKIYLASLKISEELGDKKNIAYLNSNIGNIYFKKKNIPKLKTTMLLL